LPSRPKASRQGSDFSLDTGNAIHYIFVVVISFFAGNFNNMALKYSKSYRLRNLVTIAKATVVISYEKNCSKKTGGARGRQSTKIIVARIVFK
jgi:hypothetical protein